ncbi:aromatic ring-hydroxylating oxygenase subunit alpha [Zavarzinia sp. CC-PAN008]|uniref:aromatic ring-hydroxylating oxygenase subunit alpha n=1 Tax=Zavarzinia sp. CC-PAN008 TaxID=3243332 RepID=UPI003F746136
MGLTTQGPAQWDDAALGQLFDAERGLIDRRIYADEAIYKLEMERIFARGWNFMCHETQIPNVGDYFINYIGEDQVIVVRDETGKVNVMLNTCRHRGNALCRAEQGNTKSFVCSYHGWNYALDGRLVGLPGQRAYYRDGVDKGDWGLAHAAKVESYLGFYFATLDPEAPPLHDFLGEVGRAGLGMCASHGPFEVVDGIQRNVIDCNWKIAVDNLYDWYHVMYSHGASQATGLLDLAKALHPADQMVMLGAYGHGIGGPVIPRDVLAGYRSGDEAGRAAFLDYIGPNIQAARPESATELLGQAGFRSMGHPSIFPNLWIAIGGQIMCLRLPRGPNQTELWWFTMMPKGMPKEERRQAVRFVSRVFGPAGILEQDDGENWSQSTRAARGFASSRLPHNVQMGLGKDTTQHEDGQTFIESPISEHGQRWTYRAWSEWMRARSWPELIATHSQPPRGVV